MCLSSFWGERDSGPRYSGKDLNLQAIRVPGFKTGEQKTFMTRGYIKTGESYND